MKIKTILGGSLLMLSAAPALADDWSMYLTVDNQFAAYFGTATQTTFSAGQGTNWGQTYHYTALNRPATDYVYVATSSDQSGYQGFIGVFTNTTTGASAVTGNAAWQVFPAGKYAATNPFSPNGWPASLMPTQAQVDTAIAYATANNLWVNATGVNGYTNGINPWGMRPDIPAYANWIWYDSGRNGGPPSPLVGSFNHDEFLVFRINSSALSACYANCDSSSAAPILNIQDFVCFMNRFALGSPWANCDNSTTAPVLNVEDFNCFINKFAVGCS
jgi:hypothetical protein